MVRGNVPRDKDKHMGVFSDLKNAKASGGGRRYLRPGTHRLRVDSVKFDESRTHVKYFAVSGMIVATTSTDPEMAVGNAVDWSTHADKDAYFGNVKQFICAATGTMEKDFDALDPTQGEQLVDMVAGTRQVLTGKVVEAICIDQTSKAGNVYTAVRWQPVNVVAAQPTATVTV